MIEVKIDYEKCTGCGKCARCCNFSVLEILDDAVAAGNPGKCTACLKCEAVCESGAIKIVGQSRKS